MVNHCKDCGVGEGELHLEGCDNESCSKCGRQVLCWGKCEGAKPEPYFKVVSCCARCGEILPDMFMVSNEEWDKCCGVTYDKKEILCKKCFDFIMERRNNG